MRSRGTTLVEVVVAISILAILSLGIYGAFDLFFQVLANKKNRTEALAIANEKMEILRTMPYADIGTIGGIPPGSLLQTETVTRNHTDFTVLLQVAYVDDPFDGTLGGIPDDLLNTDYKRARVTVSWQSPFGVTTLYLLSDIAPRGIESALAGGTLAIKVFDANGLPVEGATVNIVNASLTPAIAITTPTDSQGKTTFPGAPESIEGYHITVSKTGYSTDQTYARTADMPQPLQPDITVLDQELTEASFFIDRVSTLAITTYSTTWTDNWRVNTDSGSAEQTRPAVTTGNSNNLYVSWQDDRQGSSTKIYAQKYNSNLVAQWSGDVVISTANNQSHPSMTSDSGGYTYIAWQDDRNGNQDVYLLKINGGGIDVWNGPKKLNTDATSADQTAPAIVWQDDAVYAAWTDERSGNSDIYLTKIDSDKTALWPSEVLMHSNSSADQTSPRLIGLDDAIYVTWVDNRNGNADIYLQHIDEAGQRQWPDDLKVNRDSNSADQLNPSVTTDGENLYIAWVDYRSGSADIYLQKISPDGSLLWSADQLASDEGTLATATMPQVVMNNGDLYLVWTDSRNGNNDIYTQKFNTDGTAVWASSLKVNDDLAGADQTQPAIVVKPNGTITYAWADDRNGDYDIFASGHAGSAPTPLGNVPLTITGSKRISDNPEIHKYQTSLTTNVQGTATLNNLEWDSYDLGDLSVANADPALPFVLLPGTAQTLKLYFP
ncbi:carboxypeptidase regulatory-like domain-containing protein [Candidatus Falkowbacteria bacterium]|nr:carboxypeptidase regulatory-like domain-containing protein [Candidatus Falkowbacteria bacterium]